MVTIYEEKQLCDTHKILNQNQMDPYNKRDTQLKR